MIRLLQSSWLAALLGELLYLLITVAVWHPPKPAAEAVHASTGTAAGQTPSWEFHNPEIEQLIGELKKEKEALAQRANQLNELATRLQTERMEINQVTQTVHQLQMDFDKNVIRVTEEETANLKKLGKTYAAMSAEGAAMIFKQLDETSLVKIMMFMKDSETAPILETLAKQSESEAKRAAAISERLRLSIAKSANKPKS